jgi:N-acetylglucosamine-6-phosphate deacetylase
MRTVITGGALVTPHEILPNHTLVIEGQRIASIEAGKQIAKRGEKWIDAQDLWVIPGMIDIHVHGGDGCDMMDATQEIIHRMGRFLASHGVTAYLPTTISASRQDILAAIENVKSCPQPKDGAHHLGVHIEGPYLNPTYKGAQPVEQLRHPDPSEYLAWLDTGIVRLITIAPELEGALTLIEKGVLEGVEFAVGHSGSSYNQILEAADRGLRQATHTFNGMLGLHHRKPGTVGAVLTDKRIYAQVIVDGIHLHPAIVKLLILAKGTSRTILITDAIRAAGLSDGDYDLGGQVITVGNGISRTKDGSLAGSMLTMDLALRNVIEYSNLTLHEALPMATSVPAEAMGFADKKGVLSPNADADVVLLDSTLNVRMTIVAGQLVYSDTNFNNEMRNL